jgi:hypothetical protein
MCCRKLSCLFDRRRPEVITHDHEVFTFGFAGLVHHRHRRFATERRVRCDHVHSQPWVGAQRVGHGHETLAIRGTDPVQQHVHRAETRGAIDDLPPMHRLVAQKAFGVRVHLGDVVIDDPLVRREQKAAGATRGVCDGLARPRLKARDHRPGQWPWGEVLTGARLRVFGALLKQTLVGIALQVRVDGAPRLLVDEVHDEAAQLCRILDPVLCLAVDRAERARLLAKRFEDVPVMYLELVTVAIKQRLPIEPVRNHLAEPRLQTFVGHLQEQQIGELLDVLDRRDAVVAQDVAEVPQLLDELIRTVHRRQFYGWSLSSSPVGLGVRRGDRLWVPETRPERLSRRYARGDPIRRDAPLTVMRSAKAPRTSPLLLPRMPLKRLGP